MSTEFFNLGFWGGNFFLFAPFPYHCLLLPCSVGIFEFHFIGHSTHSQFTKIVTASSLTIEPHREKTGFLPMRKQRRRSADQRLCFRYTDSTFPLLLISEISSF